jgi:flagellar assembly protein FliH
LEQLNDPLAQVNEQVQQELVLLAVSLAKAVLKTEVSMSSESLKTAIREAIAVLPLCDTEYKIHLHPQDLETIQAEMNPSELTEKRWRLLSSTEQEQGGCKVVTESNAVDMSIARRCDQIFSALLLEQGMVDDPRAD